MTNILKPGNTFKFTHSSDDTITYTAFVQADGIVYVTWQWDDRDNDMSDVQPTTRYQPDIARDCIRTGLWLIIDDGDVIYQVLSDDDEWVEITEQEFATIKKYTVAQTRALKVVG